MEHSCEVLEEGHVRGVSAYVNGSDDFLDFFPFSETHELGDVFLVILCIGLDPWVVTIIFIQLRN